MIITFRTFYYLFYSCDDFDYAVLLVIGNWTQYHEFAALEQEYVRRVEEYKSCKNRLDELQEGVQEVMDLSREELEEELKNFDQRMADRKQQVEQSKLELRKMKDANEKKWSELREKESSLGLYLSLLLSQYG